MSSNNKLLSGPVKDERITLSPTSDARQCFNRYKHLLTDEERAWYECFLAASFQANEEALKKICPNTKQRRELITQMMYEKNAWQRYTPSNAKNPRNGYSENDYTPAETSPEDALIDWIDTAHAKKDS